MLLQIIEKMEKLFFTPLRREIMETRFLLGQLHIDRILDKGIVENLSEVEFKVFSQWGDDGIIQYLIHNIDLPNKTFIEFGVENYTEANTRFLLMNNNWSGLIMDGSEKNIRYIRKDPVSWRYDLQTKAVFITAENINDLILSTGFEKEVGILHIDIDGNDYYIWDAVKVITPVIVIMEYSSVFGSERTISSIYDPAFVRSSHHYSNMLYGASLASLVELGKEKGYSFIGCNTGGNNAYFVRNDKVGKLKVKAVKDGYVEAKFMEGRNADGTLSYLRGDNKLKAMKGSKVFNTTTKQTEDL